MLWMNFILNGLTGWSEPAWQELKAFKVTVTRQSLRWQRVQTCSTASLAGTSVTGLQPACQAGGASI